MKRGFTLIELIVAMGIFTVVSTLAVSSVVMISNVKALGSTMRESQQKVRLATEIITRLARQAEVVVVSPDGKTLSLFFDTSSRIPSAAKFSVDTNGSLNYSDECTGSIVISTSTPSCLAWNPSSNLLEGSDATRAVTLNTSGTLPFVKTMAHGTPELDIYFNGSIAGVKRYYQDNLVIQTSVILEALK